MAPFSSQSFIDTHCHFDFEVFDATRAALWLRCQKEGVSQLIMPGVSPDQWPILERLCEDLPGLYFSVGVHPYWLEQFPLLSHSQQSQLEGYIATDRCVAIGECGIDGSLPVSLETQKAMFECHVRFACHLQKPLIVHAHKAHHWVLQILAKHSPPAGGVIHGFTGSIELAADYWSKGFYIGVGGSITYQRASKTRDTVSQLPLSSLLLETDAPDMPLSGFQGQTNSPLKVLDVARALAQLQDVSMDVIAVQTTANARQLFDFK